MRSLEVTLQEKEGDPTVVVISAVASGQLMEQRQVGTGDLPSIGEVIGKMYAKYKEEGGTQIHKEQLIQRG